MPVNVSWHAGIQGQCDAETWVQPSAVEILIPVPAVMTFLFDSCHMSLREVNWFAQAALGLSIKWYHNWEVWTGSLSSFPSVFAS